MQLLDYLIENYKDLSRNKIKTLLTKGAVTVNGKVRTRHDFLVEDGMVVKMIRGKEATISNAERNMRRFATIEYEDSHLIVVNKKIGVLSVPTGSHGFCLKTLLDEYLQRKGERSRVHVVHRLDKETSGLMLFAKNRDVQYTFTHNWREIITDRRYYAVTSGIPAHKEGVIESYLTEDKFCQVHSSKIDNGGKLAITHYQMLVSNGNYALMGMKLETGRKNQIRVHLQDLGCPVIGDRKYGNGDDPIGRLGLHAFRLCFVHPVTGEHMDFETPLPSPFCKLLGVKP